MRFLTRKLSLLKHRSLLTVFLYLTPLSGFTQSADSLTLKIGQMIMVGLSGTAVDTSTGFYKDIREGKVGGISIYEANLTPEHAAENLRTMLEAYQSAAPIPLFTAITQEGGIVNRLKTRYGFPPMPSAAYLGKLNNPDSSKYYADNIAYTLSRLGINLNFAPVVDVYMATNPVLGSRERTYSADPASITQQAAQMIRSHNYFKVSTSLKHFPGHGSSTTDSHLGLTDVSATWKKEELEPYRRLIRSGLVKAIMTAHIVNTQLDPSQLPATLSRKVITGLLRKDLQFKGVVFSDDMNMKAISAEYGLKEAIEMAINAGVDVLLFSGKINGVTPNGASDVVAIIKQLIAEGKITTDRINTSYQRILKMKKERLTLDKLNS
ncbi:MAG TPA: glycoside hydrolase family 3 N-terminal domain-containing protein [Flavisolibacter sp.]|jgi:beta-N-acetylhexosaminidase|nr:glycoside hydrolase family 3 N-terminal domain-containing protein [Flavisolibacter sp.]